MSKAFWTVTRAIRALVRARRAAVGPRRPSWSDDYETLAEVLRQYARVMPRLPLDLQRAATNRSLPRPPRIATELRRANAGGVPAVWVEPPASSGVLFYLHGGGYSIGSIESHRDLLQRLAGATELRVLAIDYRLAPEHRFPAPLDDAIAAYRWLLEHERVAPERLVLGGESAGGGLTLALLVAARDRGLPLPAAAVCISPWVDLELRGASIDHNARYDFISRPVLDVFADRYVTRAERAHPLVSPLNADLHGLPPLFVHAGGAEALVDEARLLHERALAAGVAAELAVEPDMIHAWHLFAGIVPEGERAIETVATFVRRALER